MEPKDKNKRPKKLAMLAVPLAAASPLAADLPAVASEVSQQTNPSDSPTQPQALTTEITAVIPEVKKVQAKTYRVKSGDTVSQIAKKFGVSVSKIARLNNLGPTSLIRVGQVLVISGSAPKSENVQSYKVRSGDNLSKIAQRFNLSVDELVALNRISSSTIIYPGQILRVAKIIPASASATQDSYQVQPGDTLKSIAKNFGLTVSNLRSFNSLSKASIIYVGQNLHLKPGLQSAAGPSEDDEANQNQKNLSSVSFVDPSADSEATDSKRPVGACTLHGYHTVQAGETVSKIAAVYGVSTQSVLTQNSLGWSTTIYVGQRLQIPGVHEIQFCPSITKLSFEMLPNAEIIYLVGKSIGVSDYGIVIALATAMQESSLRNIEYGDLDSIGLFQQRPSQGWGTKEQIMNPSYAAQAFFGGPSGPNFGKVRGLLDIKNWQSMSLTQAAQAVQVSAFPDAYQKWELSAWSWLDQLAQEHG